MRKVIQEEVSEWICDATGKKIEDSPSGIIEFSFGYGSNLDGLHFLLDLSDDAAQDIMDMLCDKYPNIAKIVKEKIEDQYGEIKGN